MSGAYFPGDFQEKKAASQGVVRGAGVTLQKNRGDNFQKQG